MQDHGFLSEILFDSENDANNEKSTKNLNKKTTQFFSKNESKRPKGGYKPVLVDESCLAKESADLKEPFELINKTCLNDKNYMTDQDIVSFYLITYLNQRYPNQMIENFNKIIETPQLEINQSKSLTNDLKFCFKNKNINAKLEKLKIKTLFDLINSFNLHSVPYSARYTLVNWYMSHKFDLVLFINKIPNSKDVLEMQANSKRCVSLIADQIDRLVMNERDPLSFLLHDLVHAYKMFSNDYLFKGQVGFSRAVLKIYEDSNKKAMNILNTLSNTDESFSQDFDYLISDMNSHPKHLFHYFKAILINAFKRKFDLTEGMLLSGESLNEFNELFEAILEIFKMDEIQKDLARKMLFEDSQHLGFNSIDFTLLDNYFLGLTNKN